MQRLLLLAALGLAADPEPPGVPKADDAEATFLWLQAQSKDLLTWEKNAPAFAKRSQDIRKALRFENAKVTWTATLDAIEPLPRTDTVRYPALIKFRPWSKTEDKFRMELGLHVWGDREDPLLAEMKPGTRFRVEAAVSNVAFENWPPRGDTKVFGYHFILQCPKGAKITPAK